MRDPLPDRRWKAYPPRCQYSPFMASDQAMQASQHGCRTGEAGRALESSIEGGGP
jgi:hypothetical protein